MAAISVSVILAWARKVAKGLDCPNYIGGEKVFCVSYGPCPCWESAERLAAENPPISLEDE